MSDAKIKAPRGTYDVLGEQASIRSSLESNARAILQGAGYQRIETPAFEATELFARGVGSSTDIVQKEMYTFEDGSRRSLTLRPEGTAPVCRAYVEHGMHKLRQPVRLWYLSSFFRYERAQAGRYRQFWQVGAEALGTEDPALDAESIILLGSVLEDMNVNDVRLRLSSLGSPETRQEYRQRLQEHLRANEASLSEEVRGRIESNPLRAFDSDHEGTRRGNEGRAKAARPPRSGRPSAFRRGARAARGGQRHLRGRQHARQGSGLLHEDRLRVHLPAPGRPERGRRRAGATTAWSSSWAGPATPGIGWAAGVERILLAGEQAPAAPATVELFIALDGDRRGLRRTAFGILNEARSAGLAAQMELGGRSLKGQLGHATAIGARFVAVLGGGGETLLKDAQTGEQQTVATNTVVHAVLRRHHAL